MSTKLIKNIEALGKMRGENLKQIGKNSGVGENAIYRWDKHEPKLSTIRKVADYLGVTTQFLFKLAREYNEEK